jgi:hypothetical protein
MNRPQYRYPLLAGHEDLGHVPGHGHQIRLHGGQGGGIGVHPADPAGAVLAPGDLEGGGGRVGRDDLQAAAGQQAGEGAGAAPDIQDGPRAELGGQRCVGIEIGTVGVQRVVELRQPGYLEMRISHAKNPTAAVSERQERPFSDRARMSARQAGKK